MLIWKKKIFSGSGNMSETFIMRDEAFRCLYCGKTVEPLGYTARDHCPHCLHSLHVDDFPGDRACSCHGLLVPRATEKWKNDCKIIFVCAKCGAVKKNKAAHDDDPDLLIALSANAVPLPHKEKRNATQRR
jgi:DNA-directed RNA polymerase subunit RPC12/RpoP